MMWDMLIAQELAHMRHELQQLFEAIPEGYDNRQFLLLRTGARQRVVIFLVQHIAVDGLVTLDVIFAVAGI